MIESSNYDNISANVTCAKRPVKIYSFKRFLRRKLLKTHQRLGIVNKFTRISVYLLKYGLYFNDLPELPKLFLYIMIDLIFLHENTYILLLEMQYYWNNYFRF